MAANDVLAANVGLPAVIAAPPLTLPPISLPNVGRFIIDERAGVDPTDGRWQSGITFRPEPKAKAGGWAPCGADLSIPEDCADYPPPVWLPFAATYTSRAPLAQYQVAEWQQRADRGLRAHEAWRVENEFWTGTLQPGNPYLAKPNSGSDPWPLTGAAGYDIVTPGAAVSLKEGIARLDQAIADADVGIGVIHLTPYMLQRLVNTGGSPVRYEGGRILTVNGNWLLPGYGYQGTGPDATGGPDANVQWLYATDMTYLARGNITYYPDRFPTNFDGERIGETSDFAQSLILAGSEVPMAAQWTAQALWIVFTNTGLRAGIKIDATA